MENSLGKLSLDQKHQFEIGEMKTFGDIDVEPFGVAHDAVESMFFTFHNNNKKVALVTDLGYVSDRIKKTIETADAYVFEANHDVGMLRMGRYPWSVKRRILGDSGHVSNEDCALGLCDIIASQTQ